MNEMYEYLKGHNYISKNENKSPLRQQELSGARAECIVNKYINLAEKLERENKLLKNNWHILKIYLLEKDFHGYEKLYIDSILNKMKELEGGSSNE